MTIYFRYDYSGLGTVLAQRCSFEHRCLSVQSVSTSMEVAPSHTHLQGNEPQLTFAPSFGSLMKNTKREKLKLEEFEPSPKVSSPIRIQF